MNTDHPLPPHLQRIGGQLTAAAAELYGPAAARRSRPRRIAGRLASAPRLALAGAGAGTAAAIAAVLLFATAGAPPAYALTTNSDGTYTLTINDISIAIPALNARLAQLGIDVTAVPVTTSCTAPSDGVALVSGWPASTINQSITLDQADVPAGEHGVIAAYVTPQGGIDLTIESSPDSEPVPSCLNADNTGYGIPVPSPGSGANTGQ